MNFRDVEKAAQNIMIIQHAAANMITLSFFRQISPHACTQRSSRNGKILFHVKFLCWLVVLNVFRWWDSFLFSRFHFRGIFAVYIFTLTKSCHSDLIFVRFIWARNDWWWPHWTHIVRRPDSNNVEATITTLVAKRREKFIQRTRRAVHALIWIRFLFTQRLDLTYFRWQGLATMTLVAFLSSWYQLLLWLALSL